MKKIPTLFERQFEGHRIVDITDKITPGCEEAFLHGTVTVKFDGSCCAIINGVFYKRYDAKKGKKPPENAIPCCDPDPITGHWPHWVPVSSDNPGDKWFVKALEKYNEVWADPVCRRYPYPACDGTYEACGPHFNGNPYNMEYDILIPHGKEVINGISEDKFPLLRTFESVRDFFLVRGFTEEGLVFWLNGEPVCKIKRTDFGLKWPVKE